MKILIINGSPKAQYSITLQTCRYLEIMFPEHSFSYLHIGRKIRALEKDFSPAVTELNEAELIIFSYPVYTFIAPSQLHKFIELMKMSGLSLAGKWATQITTSKHFYDVTAHKYIEDNCHDMGLKYVKGLSADMDDLTKKKGQTEAVDFLRYVLWCTEKDYSEKPTIIAAAKDSVLATVPENIADKEDGDVVVVTDATENDFSLNKMIARFCAVSSNNVRVLNLHDFDMKGGCLGCMNCAVTSQCVYKDGFSEILRNNIQSSDAIVYAFSIKDHSMGPLFKMYDDRQFCNGHRSVTMGRPVAYLISGNYSAETNLQMILEGRGEVGGNFIAGIATDEADTDYNIDKLAENLSYAITYKFNKPANFLGVGGSKIFRDLVYMMRGMMRADHKFYKEHNQYDFPQKHKVMSMAMYLVGAMLGSDKIRAKMGNKMNEGMLMPYEKILNDAKKNK